MDADGALAKHPTAGTYIATYGWLLILTLLEIGVVLAGIPKVAVAAMLIATALAKALLIALYFMHLKFDRRVVWIFPGIPVAIGIVFVLALSPDIVFHLAQRM